jgi:soluble lytic murein transglycosylase-like protein
MESSGPRWLIGLAVTAAIAAATSADADVTKRATRDGVAYRRTAFTPPSTPGVSLRLSPGDHRAYSQEIAEASARYDVPERLIRAVIRVESGFDHRAVSRKGARGLMQLMPETAAMLGVRNAFDPRQNIEGGTRHLRALMERFRYDLRLAVAAYNAGEKAVVVSRGIPPYPETRDYVTRVLRFYDATIEWGQSQAGGDIQRIVGSDGSITYTNMPFGQFATVARGR